METQQSKYLFTVTHYDGGDADRVATPFVMANAALAGGADVMVWLTMDGANLGRREAAEELPAPKSFPPVAELMQAYRDNGGRIGVCPPCGKTHGVTDENMLENGEWMGAVAVLEAARDRQVHSF